MKRVIKKLAVLLTAVFMLSATAVYAADAELVSCMAYMTNNNKETGINSINFITRATRFEMKIKNNSKDDADFAMILVSFDGNGICKGVEISEPFPAEPSNTATINMPIDGSKFKDIKSIQCIAVELDETGMYPILETVKQLSNGWK